MGIFLYTLLTPQLGLEPKPHRIPHWLFYSVAGLILGFYDGFFGPGTGSFWTLALVLLLGLNLKGATARTKLFNLTSNIVALGVFIASGLVVWSIGRGPDGGRLRWFNAGAPPQRLLHPPLLSAGGRRHHPEAALGTLCMNERLSV